MAAQPSPARCAPPPAEASDGGHPHLRVRVVAPSARSDAPAPTITPTDSALVSRVSAPARACSFATCASTIFSALPGTTRSYPSIIATGGRGPRNDRLRAIASTVPERSDSSSISASIVPWTRPRSASGDQAPSSSRPGAVCRPSFPRMLHGPGPSSLLELSVSSGKPTSSAGREGALAMSSTESLGSSCTGGTRGAFPLSLHVTGPVLESSTAVTIRLRRRCRAVRERQNPRSALADSGVLTGGTGGI